MARESIKSDKAIATIRRAGKILADVHTLLGTLIGPGVTGLELDTLAETFIRDHGAEPAFKGFDHFPATICFSVNEGMVHGLPSDRVIQPGDVVKLDVGVRLNGWNTDAARTHLVAPVDPANQQLLNVTRAALAAGVAQVRDGVPLGTVQAAIQQVIDDAHLGLVRQLTGHGIGRSVHEPPSIPNFGRAGEGNQLRTGMVICLEPMVTRGNGKVEISPDGWTYQSATGAEILTRNPSTTVDRP